jgi:formylglycine-generating enzyme required for sulfatase activity
MNGNIPLDLLPRARQILLPLVATPDERDALLTEAFYLHDPLLYRINRAGAAYPFAVNCLKTLLDYGCLAEREHSLARLLGITRTLSGVDKHAEIDELTQLANALCTAAQPARQPVATPPPAQPAAMQTLATPRAERQPTVFLSYARADRDFAQRLMADLHAAGHACWIDTSALKGGDEWVTTIAEGILNSYAMVVVVTPSALQSRWVQDEILWARQKHKLIIPVLLADVVDEPRFFPLAGYQAVTFWGCVYASGLAELQRALPSPALPEPECESAPAPDFAPTLTPPSVPPRDVPRTVELAYLERLRLEELLNTEKYTPLGGASQQQVRRAEMRAVFELLPMTKRAGGEWAGERRRFENAVAEIRRLRRAVLLGEPGGGKTTTLWKLAAELVDEALADPKAPLPLLIRLGRWTDAEQPLAEFIAGQLGELGSYLDVLLSGKRAALLLDGLNELPASQHPDKYPQVQQFIQSQPHLLASVSCRELDYTIDLEFDRINITPLDPLRIREFVGRYLGEAQGEALFWRLAGSELKGVWDVWQQAGAGFELFWTTTEIPKENPNVYGVTTGEQDRLWQEKDRATHTLMELARNPYMLLMLTSVYAEQGRLPDNRGELFRLFVQTLFKRERIPEAEQTPLADGLARVAFEMQTRRSASEAGDALTVLPKAEVQRFLDERQLYLAGSASLLSVGEQVRFTHQLLQEYFAAHCMDRKINTPLEDFKAYDIWLSERWWERTNWEEAAILLAGLYSNDCTPVVDWVAQGNPEVAAQCIVRSGAALAEATRERLCAEWLERLTDVRDEPAPQGRAAVGRALDLTGWDHRRGVALSSDGLPDLEWTEIPAGSFKYGGDKSAGAAEPQNLSLPTFRISRFPITYVQFQAFLDAADGYHDPRWWTGLAAQEQDRQPAEQSFKFSNHPRETVSWFEAIAFCRWLSWRWGGGYDLRRIDEWAVRLPTEFEWEKAARGTDGWLYPYGNEFDAAKGNTSETGLGQTSAVGIFPSGASPYGVEEMSGNVWEWCLSSYETPQLEPRSENLAGEDRRVLRGGSWIGISDFARAVSRDNDAPGFRFNYLGFRVVVGGPPS